VQVITSSGNFTVPAGVTMLLAMAIGGGGSGGTDWSGGNSGTQTTFGSYLVAPGGNGGGAVSDQTVISKSGYASGAGIIGIGSTDGGGTYGAGGNRGGGSGGIYGRDGTNGPAAVALIPVTPGSSISATIGTGGAPAYGSGYSGAGASGAVVIRW
jgi:hypothetical protein